MYFTIHDCGEESLVITTKRFALQIPVPDLKGNEINCLHIQASKLMLR